MFIYNRNNLESRINTIMLLSDYNKNEKVSRNVASNRLYSDIPLSFAIHPNTKDIRPITDIAAVRQAVKVLVLSNYVDRPFHPELGGNVTAYLFESTNKFTAIALRDEITRLLRKNEPRISNTKVQIEVNDAQNRILVTILFTINSSNTNTEVSFFLNRIR